MLGFLLKLGKTYEIECPCCRKDRGKLFDFTDRSGLNVASAICSFCGKSWKIVWGD